MLILDEPTTGLDPRGRLDLWGVIEELVADGATLLLTTQYLEEADRLADRIAVVDHGRVIAAGTAAELKSQLGSTIIHVEVSDPSTADAAKTVLAEVGPTDLSDDGRSIEVKVDRQRTVVAGRRPTARCRRDRTGRGDRARAESRRRVLDATGRPTDVGDNLEEAS